MAQVAVTYDSVMNELKAHQFKPVYYLAGDESYYIDKISDWIAENVLQPEERDFNQTVLFGSDVTASQVVDAAKRYPMMAEHQVIIVKEAQNIKNTEPLERYFKQPMASTILVMCHKNGKIDGRKTAYVKAIRETGVLFESMKMKERGIPTIVWLSPILPYINDTQENLRAILDACIKADVKGIICFGMGLTLRDGDREYYYDALDRHFPGLKERYIMEYGNAYELPSPNTKKLMSIFANTCREHNILCTPDACFAYLGEFPEKYRQLSLFDID